MDFNDIISVDLKELQPEYRKNGYRYILYIVDEFSKLMRGVLIKDKEAETVVMCNGGVHALDNRNKRMSIIDFFFTGCHKKKRDPSPPRAGSTR